MRSRRIVRLVIVSLVLGGCFFAAKSMFWLPTINPHRGDGTFTNRSWRAGPFAVPG